MANKKMKTIDFGTGDVYELTPDWDKIDGRPFGESTTYGDTLTWDGNTDGKAIVGDMVCHISDAVPTIEDCANGVMATFADGSTAMGTATPMGEGLLMLADSEGILCVATDNLEFNGMVFPKKGIYVIYDGLYVSSLTINGYNGFERKEITPVPTEYLPEHLQFGIDRSNLETLIDNKTITVSGGMAQVDVVAPEASENIGNVYKVVFDGIEYECEVYEAEGSKLIGNLAAVGVPDAIDSGEPFAIAMGMVFCLTDGEHTLTLAKYGRKLLPLANCESIKRTFYFKSGSNVIK